MTRPQKITLSASRDIPFDRLVLSQSNVRHVKAGVSIKELAEDIARRTLLASLTIRPVLDASGAETGMFPEERARVGAFVSIDGSGRLLEALIAEGISLVERRNAYEAMRDLAAEAYEVHLGQAWRPRAGSHVSRRALTATLIDSRDHLAARRRAALEPLLPEGPKIAFAGGADIDDHAGIWFALDRVRAKHPGMVLLHGGAPRGAERIAAAWADSRGCAQIVFRADWTRHGKAAPFRRNDRLLEVLPIGLVVFPGSGITDNLADKARALGIPLFDFRPRRSRSG